MRLTKEIRLGTDCWRFTILPVRGCLPVIAYKGVGLWLASGSISAEHIIHSAFQLATRTSLDTTHYRTMNFETSLIMSDETSQTADTGLSQANSAGTTCAVATIVTISETTPLEDSVQSLELDLIGLGLLDKQEQSRVDTAARAVRIRKATEALSEAANKCIEGVKLSTAEKLDSYLYSNPVKRALSDLIEATKSMTNWEVGSIKVAASDAEVCLQKVTEAMNKIEALITEGFKGKELTSDWEVVFSSVTKMIRDMHSKLALDLGRQQ